MSIDENTKLLERAAELEQATEGMSWIPEAIRAYVTTNDLEGLEEFLNFIEANQAIEYFHNNNVIEYGDVY